MIIKLQNLGTVNKNKVMLFGADNNRVEIYFSYETPVSINGYINHNGAMHDYFDVTRQNDWSTTTGKLLNECEPDKTKRVTGEAFEQELTRVLSAFK